MQKITIILFLILFLIPAEMHAQEKQRRDSLYQKIENFSRKTKTTRFLYRILFRNAPDSVTTAKPSTENVTEKYLGKHIRNIHITTYDPLGYDKNLNQKQKRWYEQAANKLHNNSKDFAVRGYLLFKKGDAYNPQKIYESERMLRSTQFVNRVSIYPIDSTASSDSVDIAVRVLDSWSLKPTASWSAKKIGFGITEENFLGMGHELEARYRLNTATKQHFSKARYASNNIYGTYINAGIVAERDFDRNENVNFSANRDFFSPFTRWAGGFSLNFSKRSLQIPTAYTVDPTTFPTAGIKVQTQDFWGGYQFRLQPKDEKEVTDNLVLSARVQNIVFVDGPPAAYDPGNFYSSHTTVLGSVGFTERKFTVMKNVYQYDLPEDIPYGKNIFFTGGLRRDRSQKGYPYAGLTASYGTFGKFGYINFRAQGGAFFKEKKDYRSTVRLDGMYFTPLQDWNFSYARHFLSPTFVLGNHRNSSLADRINLSQGTEFPAFNSFFIGESKLVLRYQLQLFIKKTWKNFHFNPYVNATAGFLAQDQMKILQSKPNWKFGLGVMFYNPYLAFNRFQVSLVYYPKVPFDGRSVFEVNDMRNYSMPMNTFTAGQPGIVPYN